MGWIAWFDQLEERPEVMGLAIALKIDTLHAAGACAALWAWADREGHTGKGDCCILENVTGDMIDRKLRLPGFAEAMSNCPKWFTVDASGIRFHRWSKRNSPTAKERLLASKRQARKRERDSHGAVTVPSRKARDSLVTTNTQPNPTQPKRDIGADVETVGVSTKRGDARGGDGFVVEAADMADGAKLHNLYFDAVQRGWVTHSDAAYRDWFSAAAHARRKGEKPEKLFAAMARQWPKLNDHISVQDERASEPMHTEAVGRLQ